MDTKSTKGIHQPNCFMVPTTLLTVLRQLRKDEILCIIHLLAGENDFAQRMTDAIEQLQSKQILDKSGNIIWSSTGGRITLSQKQESSAKEPSTEQSLEDLPDNVNKLYNLWIKDLASRNIPATNKRQQQWISKMMELMESPNFDKAVEITLKKKIGFPGYIAEILSRWQSKRDDKLEDEELDW